MIVIPGSAVRREPGIHFSKYMPLDGFRARVSHAPE